jgi:hypothetical protein
MPNSMLLFTPSIHRWCWRCTQNVNKGTMAFIFSLWPWKFQNIVIFPVHKCKKKSHLSLCAVVCLMYLSLSYVAASYFIGHNWLVSSVTLVKPVILTLVHISFLSDDKIYISISEVLIDTNLQWLHVPGRVTYVPWFISVLNRIM